MPIPALLAGAAISTGGNLLGNALSNAGNKRSQQRANKFNVEFWNMQNKYNDPSNQMARLKKAGLNPNLIYGTSPSSATGNAGQIAPSKASDYKIENPLRDFQMYAATRSTEAQIDNLKTQNTVMQQDAILKSAQTAGTLATTARTRLDYQVANQLKQTSVDYAKENLRRLELQSIGSALENKLNSKTLADKAVQIGYQAQIARDQLSGIQLENHLKKLEIDLRQLGLQNNDPWILRLLGRGLNKALDSEQLKQKFLKK